MAVCATVAGATTVVGARERVCRDPNKRRMTPVPPETLVRLGSQRLKGFLIRRLARVSCRHGNDQEHLAQRLRGPPTHPATPALRRALLLGPIVPESRPDFLMTGGSSHWEGVKYPPHLGGLSTTSAHRRLPGSRRREVSGVVQHTPSCSRRARSPRWKPASRSRRWSSFTSIPRGGTPA